MDVNFQSIFDDGDCNINWVISAIQTVDIRDYIVSNIHVQYFFQD